MSPKIREQLEFIRAQLVQGKPVPLYVPDERESYLEVLTLLKALGIEVPEKYIRYEVLAIDSARIDAEPEHLWRARCLVQQLGFRVLKKHLKHMKCAALPTE